MSKFSFPKIESVSINNFSLYKKKDEINLDMNKAVFCLAGANGLGKSTFLNIVNFGLTGIVIDPSKSISSIVSTAKLYSANKNFALEYFDGRIEEIDRESSSVKIKFSVGEIGYELERSFFEKEELISYSRFENNKDTIVKDTSNADLFTTYKTDLTKDIRLATFDQFVFIQHFVLSFDEQHNLIFWNSDLMETSLYLFFDVDVENAKKANELRKDVQRLGSNIRNFTYHKNRLVKDFEKLKFEIAEQGGVELPDDVLSKYDKLEEKLEKTNEGIETNKNNIRNADLKLSDLTLKLLQAQNDYQSKFNEMFVEEESFLNDHAIKSLLLKFRDESCKNGNTSNIADEISQLIKSNYCKKSIPKNKKGVKILQEIDKSISESKKQIDAQSIRKERLLAKSESLKLSVVSIVNEIDEVNKEFGKAIKQIKSLAGSDFSGLTDAYDKQIKDKVKEIEEKRKQKKEFEKDLGKLERLLNKSYAGAEETFIPMFNKYAKSFLGLEVSLNLRNSKNGTTLILVVEDQERNEVFQLSESQRYFVDIALRMAFIEYSCDGASFLVDTPEGSLDIAYESKAGKMFGEFSELGYNILMTANINTSQLLIELAKLAKKDNMSLERMTEWTLLSEVQIQEESKILDAYSQIEKELN